MFRARQNMRSGVMTACFDMEFVKNDKTGFSTSRLVNACRNLPDPSNFDLEKLVVAGVDLKRVNTAFIDNRPTDLSQFESADVDVSQPESPKED